MRENFSNAIRDNFPVWNLKKLSFCSDAKRIQWAFPCCFFAKFLSVCVFFFFLRNQETTTITISPVLVSMHIQAIFLTQCKKFLQNVPEARTIAVCLSILKELYFTLSNFMTELEPADLTNVTVIVTLTKGFLKSFQIKKLLLEFHCKQKHFESQEKNYENSRNHKESSPDFLRNFSQFR